VGATGSQSKKQRDLSVSLKEQYTMDAAFIVKCITHDDNEEKSAPAEVLEKSLACFQVALEDKIAVVRRGEKLVSFGYVAAAVCLKQVEAAMLG